jgi:hypothetical protein
MLKVARKKCKVIHKGKPIRIKADLSDERFQDLKQNNYQSKLLYTAKISLK